MDTTDVIPTTTWPVFTRAHARTLRKPTKYLVDRFIETQSVNIVYGSPASMKSMLLVDLAMHVAMGTPWLPGAMGNGGGVSVMQGAVLWVDFDNGEKRTHQRIDAVAQAHKAPDDVPFFYVSMPVPPLIAHDLDSMVTFRDTIAMTQARLVIVDNLGNITGDVEENSAGMAQIMGNIRAIAERTGAAIVIIHHQRKGGAAGGRAGEALRGHSSIEAALDLALHVVRAEGEAVVTISSTKTRGVDVPVISAKFNFEHIPGTSDLAAAWFEGTTAKPSTSDVIELEIYHALQDRGGLTKTTLATAVKNSFGIGEPGLNTIRAFIDQMIADGKLLERASKGNRKVIDVP